MKVMRFNENAQSPSLAPGIADVPKPGAGQLLIKVCAAGVTPTELQWYPSTHLADGQKRSGAIPGHEFSGVVAEVGAGVDPAQVGREVFGMNDWFAEGATAEFCLTVPASVASKPTRLTHQEAASVPIGALTAWQGLLNRAKLQSGERVLIHGGSGAVGLFAIQFARRSGAHVITTGSPQSFDLLSRLGAAEIIDYRRERFEEQVGPVDVVFDTVGGETLRRSWELLKSGGRLVTIAADSEGTKDERVEKAFFIVQPDREQLTRIADLLDAGELECCVDAVVPFMSAPAAYQREVAPRRGFGKMVISVDASAVGTAAPG